MMGFKTKRVTTYSFFSFLFLNNGSIHKRSIWEQRTVKPRSKTSPPGCNGVGTYIGDKTTRVVIRSTLVDCIYVFYQQCLTLLLFFTEATELEDTT